MSSSLSYAFQVLLMVIMVGGCLLTLYMISPFYLRAFPLIKHALNSRGWPRVSGTVTQLRLLERVNEDEVKVFCPEALYTYEVDGVAYTGTRIVFDLDDPYCAEVSARSLIKKLEVGKTSPVAYDPAQPSESVLYPGFARPTWKAMLVGCFFLLISINAIRFIVLEVRLPAS